uniref:Uncharacterized protein n=1 Tax=Rhizophora mucronata TaxID=61149 RepID=A0A2P2JDD6_RHIMU
MEILASLGKLIKLFQSNISQNNSKLQCFVHGGPGACQRLLQILASQMVGGYLAQHLINAFLGI